MYQTLERMCPPLAEDQTRGGRQNDNRGKNRNDILPGTATTAYKLDTPITSVHKTK